MTARAIRRRRGTTAEHSGFTGLEGEMTCDTDKLTLVAHDGATAGGFPLAREDMDNVSQADIAAKGLVKTDMSNLAAVDGSGLWRGFIGGLVLSNDAGDTDHDIAVSAGQCRDAANTMFMVLSSAVTKRIDAAWAEGDDAGGLPSGLSLSADTWYHVFVIAKTDGTTDAGFDTSLSATNLLADAAGYAKYRRIGSVLTDGSSNIIGFEQDGDTFWYKQRQYDYNATSGIPTSATDLTVSTPTGLKVHPIMSGNLKTDANENSIRIESKVNGTGDRAWLASESAANSRDRTSPGIAPLTDTSSRLKLDADAATATVFLVATHGYIDTRGKGD